jgi:hypothetical protein
MPDMTDVRNGHSCALHSIASGDRESVEAKKMKVVWRQDSSRKRKAGKNTLAGNASSCKVIVMVVEVDHLDRPTGILWISVLALVVSDLQ